MAKSPKPISKAQLKAKLKATLKPSKDLVDSITKKLKILKLSKDDSPKKMDASLGSDMAEKAIKNLEKLRKQTASKTASLAKLGIRPGLKLK